MATKKKYEIGKEIEAFCTKCKLDRLHAIETLKSDGNINRVLCRTCDGSHLFRRPKGDGTKPPSKRRKKGSVILTDDDMKKAKPYAFDTVFAVGDVIRHNQFGPGSVVAVKADGKMEVGFEAGAKLLVCGRPK